MAYVAAVVGAGGKSSLIEAMAEALVARGNRVAVTTTTHIWKQENRPGVDYIGAECGDGKLAYPGDRVYQQICEAYDAVLVEADGSHHKPVKIPGEAEPVIPENADEIMVVMGLQGMGRPFSVVCQRWQRADLRELGQVFDGFQKDTRLTEEMIRFLAKRYYLTPLKKEYPEKQVELLLSDMRASGHRQRIQKLSLVLLASGYGRRFGSNKLLYGYRGKPLYQWTLDMLLQVQTGLMQPKEYLAEGCYSAGGDKFAEGNFTEHTEVETCSGRGADSPGAKESKKKEEGRETQLAVEVLVVSRYEEILTEPLYQGSVRMIENPDYAEGIAGSVRNGAAAAFAGGSDAVAFFVADQPGLAAEDVQRFLLEYIDSGKPMGCVYTDHPANPGVFDRSMQAELAALRGDRGAMPLIRRYPSEVHYYPIQEEQLYDLDECPTQEGVDGPVQTPEAVPDSIKDKRKQL